MQLTPTILHNTDTNEPIAPMTLASQVFREDGTTMLDALWFDAEDEEIVEDIELVKKSDIVNNLTSGGTDVPLSAEQGKYMYNLTKGMRCIPLGLGTGTVTEIEIGYQGCLIVLPRNSYVGMTSYQNSAISNIYNALPSSLSITKSANSLVIKITNNLGYTLNGFILTA